MINKTLKATATILFSVFVYIRIHKMLLAFLTIISLDVALYHYAKFRACYFASSKV